MKDELGKDVLRDVSRSFYLTLRLLPGRMREVTSLGYLLARASDTIADCGGTREDRLAMLHDFERELGGERVREFFQRCGKVSCEEGLKNGERVLMRRMSEVLEALPELKNWERAEVEKVVGTILKGQKWDLERFPEGEVTGLEEEIELESYCYRVAGCVGEFWTEIGFGCYENFSRLSKAEMRQLGRNYGCGLQLVNILRDEEEDRERGRRYLVGERSLWMGRAREYLEDGLAYAKEVRPWRVRMATVLPAMLGLKTLDLLAGSEPGERVKVSRKTVKLCLWQAVWYQ